MLTAKVSVFSLQSAQRRPFLANLLLELFMRHLFSHRVAMKIFKA